MQKTNEYIQSFQNLKNVMANQFSKIIDIAKLYCDYFVLDVYVVGI